MKPQKVFTTVFFLLATLSCITPGLSTPPPTSTPTADMRLPSMVAETFVAAVTQTALAVSPAPTFTATLEPPTFTPTSTPTPPANSTLMTTEDGGMLFIDERGGYSITIPAGWLAVRPNQTEFFDALSANALTQPVIYESLKIVQHENIAVLRLFAVDIQNETAPDQPVANIAIIFDETHGASPSSFQDVQSIADEMQKNTPGLEVTSVDFLLARNGLQFGAVESVITRDNGTVIYEKRVYFKCRTGAAYARLITGEELKNDIIPAFDAIMDTVKMIE